MEVIIAMMLVGIGIFATGFFLDEIFYMEDLGELITRIGAGICFINVIALLFLFAYFVITGQ